MHVPLGETLLLHLESMKGVKASTRETAKHAGMNQPYV